MQGIPTLAFVDGHGKLITKNGRGIVGSDPEGKEFPWLPKPLTEILQGKLKKKKEDVDSKEALTGKILGFYFSAHWVSAPLLSSSLVDATILEKILELMPGSVAVPSLSGFHPQTCQHL